MAPEANNLDTGPSRPRRRSKRGLAIRMMVAETAWLDGRPRWHNGRVAWESERGLVVPCVADFALAQRRLHQIRRYRLSADLALGDSKAWVECP